MKVTTAQQHLWDYNAAHGVLRKARGKATMFDCVDCGGQGQQWSYRHDCWAERSNDRGKYPYCTHVEHYEPRCQDCHRTYDRKPA